MYVCCHLNSMYGLCKVFLNETYERVRVGKHLSNTFHIENGFETRRCFIAIAFKICIRYAIRRVEANQGCLQSNGTHQLLVFADDVYILDGSVHSIENDHVWRLERRTKSQHKDG